MKKILIAVLLLSGITATSQSSGFGIKGGLNYGSVGDLETTTINERFDRDNKSGYHAGIFYKIEFAGLFIQPEILYTKLNTDFTSRDSSIDQNYNFEVKKIDIPILLGLDFIGPLNLKAGPSFQYILDTGFEDVDVNFNDPQEQFTIGYQLGVGVTIKQLGLDLRYEGAFSENTIVTSSNMQNAGFSVDSRPSQLILSLSFALDKD